MWHTRKDVQMRCRENRWKQKRETAGAECKVGAVRSGAEQTASPCISGREELASTQGSRQLYGNGCPAASEADCKQDLGKAHSLR